MSDYKTVSTADKSIKRIPLSVYQVLGSGELEASVILTYQNVVNIFSTSLGLLVALVNINIGATINLDLVKSIVKRPVGPLIGLVCQYILMPLVSKPTKRTSLT